LERVFLVERLPAHSRSQVSRLARHPKLHVVDSGLSVALMRLDNNSLRRSPYFGAVLETFVAGERRKQLGWASTDPRLFHFRERDTAEVDIVLESLEGQVVGIDVKSSTSTSSA